MIILFLRLFWTFFLIGLFGFGGGYAMISMIQGEVVSHYHWLTTGEFTDIVAISQSTPGPIGINCATYTGYTAVMNEGYPEWMGVIGAIVASLSVLWLPFLLMLTISKLLLKYSKTQAVTGIFSLLRPAIVGLIAAAAILLMSADNFGSPTDSPFQFIASLLIFIFAFLGTRLFRIHPIIMIILAGIAGLLIY